MVLNPSEIEQAAPNSSEFEPGLRVLTVDQINEVLHDALVHELPSSDDPRRRVSVLLRLIELVMQPPGPENHELQQRDALEQLSIELQPLHIQPADRRRFVKNALETDIVNRAADLVEAGCISVAIAACNFLGDFAFDSDAGARAALQAFDRIASRFACVLKQLSWEFMPLLEAAILLCVNIAATCPSGHPRLIPLVRHVCLQIIKNPRASQVLRGNTILLLANLSMTVSEELRDLGIAEALLELILHERDPLQKSVAESVIIFLHGDHKCEVIDQLMTTNIVEEYCVPIMQLTLRGEEFRGMYPHLMYSARLFQVLSQNREYARALAENPHVAPLLLEAIRCRELLRVESDVEGRRLALESLVSLANFGLWRPEQDFLSRDLPLLLADEHAGIRVAAAGLWAPLHQAEVYVIHLLGVRLQQTHHLPARLWQEKVMSFMLPWLESAR
jgi:hypothetical protein